MKIMNSILAVLLLAAVTGCGSDAAPLPADTKLFLVGVGPSEPDMATVRALNVIKAADVVICLPGLKKRFSKVLEGKTTIVPDYGINYYYGDIPERLHIRCDEKCRNIKKRRATLVKRMRDLMGEGKVIAVLDSGDPLLFGAWVWMLNEFDDCNPYVVPGVSSFNAAHAAIGKSPNFSPDTKSVILTNRDKSMCIPGQRDKIADLSKVKASMILFTMRGDFDEYIDGLKQGYPPETPVAVVIRAGYVKKQKVIFGTLNDIVGKIKGVDVPPFEYMIYVGDFIKFKMKKGS